MTDERSWDLEGDDFAQHFGVLFDELAPALLKYLTARAGHRVAEDLVGETFVLAIRYRSSYDPHRGEARAWLYGIASNLLRAHQKAEQRHFDRAGRLAGHIDRECPDADLVADRIDAATAVRALVPALADLSDLDRDILLLHAWADLGPSQIAQALGLSAGTVRSKLSRTRQALRMSAALSTWTAIGRGSPLAPADRRRRK